MTGIIRWQGLIFAAVVIALSYFLIEVLLKVAIEQTGSQALSTEVSLDAVNIGWSDQSLTLKGLQIVDKSKPTLNSLEINRIALQINALDALTEHLISEQAEVSGIRFNTLRSSASKYFKKEETEAVKDDSSLLGFELPDIDSLISKENSLTYQRYQSFRAYLDESQTNYETRINALKNKEKIADYKQRYEEIKSSKGIVEQLKAAAKAKTLKDDIDKDLQEIKQLRNDFSQSKKEVSRRIAELKKSPQQEADQLLEKAGFEGGTQKLSAMMFGPEVKAMLAHLKNLTSSSDSIYEATPADEEAVMPERGKGIFVQFEQKNTLPAFWLKQASLSGDLNGLGIPFGFAGKARHISDQQKLSHQPASLSLDLINDQVKSAKVNALLDKRTTLKLSLDVDIKAYQLDNVVLSESFLLNRALTDINGKLSSNDKKLNGNFNIDMNAVSLTAQGDTFKDYPAVTQALAAEDHLSAQIELAGTLDNPKISINANLDRIVNNIINKAMSAQLSEYKGQLTAKLETMMQAELGSLEGSQTEFLNLENRIGDSEQGLKGILGGL
jgi:uncharacterized protein (TIGR03545 family)